MKDLLAFMSPNRWPPSSALGCVLALLIDAAYLLVIVAAVAILLGGLSGCAASPLRPMTDKERDYMSCRADSEHVCGAGPYNAGCRKRDARLCMRDKGWHFKKGKLVKREEKCKP